MHGRICSNLPDREYFKLCRLGNTKIFPIGKVIKGANRHLEATSQYIRCLRCRSTVVFLCMDVVCRALIDVASEEDFMGDSLVLGIDAAWTSSNPSGVALVQGEAGHWTLVVAASSYGDFLGLAGEPGASSGDHVFDGAALLRAARRLGGRDVDIISVDMPLSHEPIVGRRAADDAVSRSYGARKCATHTPSAVRPGPISEHLVQTCSELGYPLCVTELRTPGLIECYPHPALVELSGAEERLCYKVARIGSYWKSSPPLERRERLLAVWETIVAMLELRMGGVRSALPAVTAISTTSSLKAYEDALDAVVCACVGICALEGRVTRHGDDTSAIWVPFGASEVAA